MTLDHRLVMLRMFVVGGVLLGAACATKTLPRRIPAVAALPPPDAGVVFEVHTLNGAGADWELVLNGGRGKVLITPARTEGVPVGFGEHTIDGTVTLFETRAVTTTTTTKQGVQTHTTYVRTAVATCNATLAVSVSYVEPRRLEVDVDRKDCAIREVEVSAY